MAEFEPKRRRSLRTLVLASNVLVGVVFLLVATVVTLAILSAQDGRRAENRSRAAEVALRGVRLDVLDSETGARGFGLGGERRFLEPYERARRALPRDLRALATRSAGQPAQRRRAAVITGEVLALEREVIGPFVAAGGRIPRERQAAFAADSKTRVDRLRRLFDQYLRVEAADQAATRARADRRGRVAIATVGVGVIVMLLALVGQQLLLRRRVLQPVAQLAEAMDRVRGGDLEARTGAKGEDEVGQLGRDFDAMTEELEAGVEDLRRSNAELEQFAYVASHDLAEPLRVMAGFAELLQRRYQGQFDERGERFLAGIIDASQRMRSLIDDLLAYSRVGRSELELEEVDTHALMAWVTEDLRSAIEEAGAEVRWDDLPVIRADAGSLRMVFQNLISNALKFRGEAPPVIVVSADRVGEEWRFSVADNGIGIDPEHADRIFRMFQRLHTRDEYEGTGIGLSLVQRSVERHGGSVAVEPREGGGTVFKFILPVANLGARV